MCCGRASRPCPPCVRHVRTMCNPLFVRHCPPCARSLSVGAPCVRSLPAFVRGFSSLVSAGVGFLFALCPPLFPSHHSCFFPSSVLWGSFLGNKGWPRYALAASSELVRHGSAIVRLVTACVRHVSALAAPPNFVRHVSTLSPPFVRLWPRLQTLSAMGPPCFLLVSALTSLWLWPRLQTLSALCPPCVPPCLPRIVRHVPAYECMRRPCVHHVTTRCPCVRSLSAVASGLCQLLAAIK